MIKKKIFILLGNSDKDTNCGHFADTYEAGAISAGHEVKRLNIGDLQFDPILHKGYKEIQALEPDLIKVQEAIKWSDHFVLFYPMWWSSMPAILKGMFDRMWIPKFAFHFHHSGMGWDKLLTGRSAHVFITMDSWPIISRFMFGDSTNEIGRAILGFSGMHPVHIKKIGPMKNMKPAEIESWKKQMSEYGKYGI